MRITVVGSINLDLVARASHLPSAGETVTGVSARTGWAIRADPMAVAAVERRKRVRINSPA